MLSIFIMCLIFISIYINKAQKTKYNECDYFDFYISLMYFHLQLLLCVPLVANCFLQQMHRCYYLLRVSCEYFNFSHFDSTSLVNLEFDLLQIDFFNLLVLKLIQHALQLKHFLLCLVILVDFLFHQLSKRLVGVVLIF